MLRSNPSADLGAECEGWRACSSPPFSQLARSENLGGFGGLVPRRQLLAGPGPQARAASNNQRRGRRQQFDCTKQT